MLKSLSLLIEILLRIKEITLITASKLDLLLLLYSISGIELRGLGNLISNVTALCAHLFLTYTIEFN